MDLDSDSNDILKTSRCRGIFAPDQFISGNGSTQSNFAMGFYNEGQTVIEQCMESVRRQVE
jgi:hypothetical protein